jgi:hypothetical protein
VRLKKDGKLSSYQPTPAHPYKDPRHLSEFVTLVTSARRIVESRKGEVVAWQCSVIPLTPVESGLIAAIGHQDGTLAVQFKNGNTYHYPADADTFTRFLSADSKGTHFAKLHPAARALAQVRGAEGVNDWPYVWRVRGRLPERFGQSCRVLVRSRCLNSVLVEFTDGVRVVTSRNYIRRRSDV